MTAHAISISNAACRGSRSHGIQGGTMRISAAVKTTCASPPMAKQTKTTARPAPRIRSAAAPATG